MAERGGALIGVEWGYEYHEVYVTAQDWSRVKGGHPLRIKGEGYCHEGEFFWDHWTFDGGLDGQLTVTYGEGDDEGVGWEGTLSEADIEEGSGGDTNGVAKPE